MVSYVRSNQTGPEKSPKRRSTGNQNPWRWGECPDLTTPHACRTSAVHSAEARTTERRNAGKPPDHSLTTLLSDVAMLTVNEVTLPVGSDRAFKLLTIKPARDVATKMQGKRTVELIETCRRPLTSRRFPIRQIRGVPVNPSPAGLTSSPAPVDFPRHDTISRSVKHSLAGETPSSRLCRPLGLLVA